MTATPEGHRRPVSQLSTRELDLYGNQLERCLKALSTNAPIRADVQRELAAVHAVRQSRTQASQPRQPSRPRDVSGLTASELERTRRELAANLALVRPDSPAPILAHISAIDTELAGRSNRQDLWMGGCGLALRGGPYRGVASSFHSP